MGAHLVRHTDLGEKVGMFMPPELSEGGFLRWETITRSRTPSHTNWWANELPALLPLRPNLAAGRMRTKGIGRVQKLQSSWGCAGGRGNRRIKEGGIGRKEHEKEVLASAVLAQSSWREQLLFAAFNNNKRSPSTPKM